MSSDDICPECNQNSYKYRFWCKPNSKHFQNDFKQAQLNANIYWKVIKWIPYYRFDVKQIGKGGFGTIHYARWIEEFIIEWDIENQQWKRQWNWNGEIGEVEVALKKFDNFVNFNDMKIHLKTWTEDASIRFYGITRDPETHSYMMVHELDIVNQDFHPGNILLPNFKNGLLISDFGLSKLIGVGVNPNNPEKKNIFVLSGDEEYTKAADVYLFGVIAYEIVTGFPPYPDIQHDRDLAMKICNGLRPKIPFHTPRLITRMIMRCWDARVAH
ncbi:hypothetical protein Glove_84g141 [Diversispora epigaea]|uniref:Protein kinase domain-containing protein n=1 Tax=Diversispora epigaea TaxID=1348612 RepID=A0A397JI24_9GLOM|nr:hypothetical protein Glove_84g141 [Diversispora epigaea]